MTESQARLVSDDESYQKGLEAGLKKGLAKGEIWGRLAMLKDLLVLGKLSEDEYRIFADPLEKIK